MPPNASSPNAAGRHENSDDDEVNGADEADASALSDAKADNGGRGMETTSSFEEDVEEARLEDDDRALTPGRFTVRAAGAVLTRLDRILMESDDCGGRDDDDDDEVAEMEDNTVLGLGAAVAG